VAQNGAAIGADAARLAVAGDSAGGNLAAVVALKAREATGPLVAFQLLIYPDLDFRRSNYSIREFAGRYGNVSRATQGWFMDHYLSAEEEKLDPLVSPLLAPDLSGLPPALIVTAEYDALRDEGEAYGERLAEAGVEATVKRYDGMIHEFMRWPFEVADRALDDAAEALRSAFGVPPTLSDAALDTPSRSVPTADLR
jgi:acetyl esterase